MSFLKKQSVGFYFSALTLIASIVGLAYYLINCNTAYFSNLGTSSLVICCAVVAIAAQALYILLGQKGGVAADIMPVIAGVALMAAAGNFAASRVNGIAAIMTFTNNAQNMADLSSAIVGIAALVIAALLNIIGSFTSLTRN